MDDLFDALSDPRRRRLLVALLNHEPQDDVRVPEDLDQGDRELEALRAEMYHAHLPKLEDAGFIDWDWETHDVSTGPRFEEIRPLLALIDDHAEELPAGWP